jgi:hypothetical protein
MKTTAFTLAAAILLGTSAHAGPVEDLVATLRSEGYTQITIEQDDGYVEVEAYRNGMEREIKINPTTGAIFKDQTKPDYDD